MPAATHAESVASLRAELSAKDQEIEATRTRIAEERTASSIALAVTKAAREAGFTYPEDVPAHVDKSLISVGDDGAIEGVGLAVARLSKERPGLLIGRTGVRPAHAALHPEAGGSISRRSPAQAAMMAHMFSRGDYEPI